MYLLITHDDLVLNIKTWEQAQALVASGKLLITYNIHGAHSVRVPTESKDYNDNGDLIDVLTWEHCQKRESILR